MRLACSALFPLLAAALNAQEPFGAADSLGPYGRVVQSWIALRVSPGREAYAMERIREFEGWRSPVFRDAPDWSIGDAVVGSAAAARAGCAAVAAAATQTPVSGRTTFVIAAQSSFAWTGLSAVIATLGDVDSVFVVTPDSQHVGTAIKVRAQFPGTLTETIREADLHALFDAVATAAGARTTNRPAPVRISGSSIRPPQPADSLTRYAELLARLTDTYAVSGDEAPMRDVIRARLPVWARELATTDTAGNLILSMGPDRDTVVFIAHLDEVGFEVLRAQNGIVTMRQLGGFYPWLFSGQPALLHLQSAGASDRAQGCRPTSGTALRGVFLAQDSGTGTPREFQAWFGDQLASAGNLTGLRVTGFKCATRLATTRFSARAIDDRLGSASLVFALDGIDPAKLNRTGAIVRALDNSSVTPPDEIERVVRTARAAGIPLQVGTTNGGNDGSVFTPFGAMDVPLSWALRYSHSPAEVIDLRDLRSLSRLITALALAPLR